jgi:hypothetical protein
VDGPVDADAGQEHRTPTHPYVLDVVIPVYNEQDDLPTCVRRLHQFLASHMPYPVPDHHRRQREHRRNPGHRKAIGR